MDMASCGPNEQRLAQPNFEFPNIPFTIGHPES